ISDLNPEIQKARDKASLNGYSKFGVEYIESVSHLMSLIHEIKDMGVLLKDADKGLCDFPYIKDGRMVYLCWHLGEDTIRYWHDVTLFSSCSGSWYDRYRYSCLLRLLTCTMMTMSLPGSTLARLVLWISGSVDTVDTHLADSVHR